MSYSKEQYLELSRRFNSKGFSGKIMLIKMHKEIFYLESDGFNFFLRLCDENAMKEEYDRLFNFPQTLEFSDFKELFKLIDIQLC